MELIIDEKKENPLLNRIEIRFRVRHPKAPTPKREDVRNLIAANLNVEKDRVIIDKMHTPFGIHETRGYAKVYNTVEDAKKIEPDYILRRNKLLEGGEGGEA